MTRGGPVKRTRDVRVRLTPAEHAAWTAARTRAGRRELGAWVRAAVNELLGQPGGEPGHVDVGGVDREQLVDEAAYIALLRAGNNLNQLAKWANTERRFPAERNVMVVLDEVRAAVVEIRAAIRTSQAHTRRVSR